MKKVLLFPYNYNCCEILRYRDMLIDYEIIGVLAPSGWGVNGKDAGIVDGGKDIGVNILETINYEQEFQGVLIVADCTNAEIEQAVLIYAEDAINHDKEIIFATEVSDKVKEMCSNKSAQITYLSDKQPIIKHRWKLLQISTPIVAIAGLNELTHKFKIQLEVNQYFRKQGYKVSHIGSKQYGELFGIHSFPDFMYSDLNETEKIYRFNKFIKDIEKQEQPDIIIVGVPGGIMPYNEKFPGYFGITMFEVMQAIRPDVLVMSCLYENYNAEYFENLATGIRYKYGIDVDAFNISTFQVDINESEQSRVLQYYKVTYNEVAKLIDSYVDSNIPIFNIMNGIDGQKIAELVLNKLQEYSEAELV
ncbi:TIGR04066 family peptide maturation system protein [Petralouisia muris]|uniref:TIGR04066 family peptide maturation system protein n=1 Tax=Petralouisia muris TaxID=3032872 RepID=A0AC61RU36_9FIRM|nr:TIGR04066 family peptide maturation system protein [Petralouisia muris]TGY95321.1 TIGR04066 family peptide maturation system protein [Petralouisia muris]